MWPVLLSLLAALLILPRLGQRPLWGDEGETALTARTVLARGLPMVYDSRWLSSYWQLTANDSLIQVRVPWLQFYVAAGPLALFGETPWSARIPFALAAIACVPCLYFLGLRLTRDRTIAVLSGLLCCTSVNFLLYARQSRYYALSMLLSVLLCWVWLHLSWPRVWSILAFALLGALGIYSNHLCGLAMAAALAMGTLVMRRPRRDWAAFGLAVAGSLALAAPWLLLAQQSLQSPSLGVLGRLATVAELTVLYLRDYAAIGLFPVLLVPLLIAVAARCPDLRRPILWLCTLVVVSTVAGSAMFLDAQYPGWSFRSVIRYQAHLIPLFALLAACGVGAVARWSRPAAGVICVLLIGTTFLWEPLNALRDRPIEGGLVSRWSPPANYLYEITHGVDDPLAVVTRDLNERATAGEQAVVSPAYVGDSLAFGTKLTYCQPERAALPKRDRAILEDVPPGLTRIDDRLVWLIDFKGDDFGDLRARLRRAYGAEFVPIALPAARSADLNRPELWWHAFTSVEPDEQHVVLWEREKE